ncbi:MAG: transposase [Ignavibacteriaceae bacterium]
MKLFRNKYRVEPNRLKCWDYSTPGWYYITICTRNMKCWFGKIEDEKVVLNGFGKTVEDFWKNIPDHYEKIELDYFVVMPNHMHGIIIINSVETGHAPSLQHHGATLGNVIGSFKSAVTKWAHQNGFTTFSWQARFYDHIIRNEADLFRIRNYIQNNPLKWESDEYYNL